MNLREFAQIGRIQTYPATLILIIVPFLLGGGNLFSWTGLFLFVFSFLIHSSTFGHNVVSDYHIDQKDPNKQHHPLITGEVSYDTAVKVWGAFLFLVELIAIVLAFFTGGNTLFAIVSGMLFLMAGHWYNDFEFSSRCIWAFIPISICFTAMSFFGYFLSANSLSMIMIFLGLYWFFRIWFQISYSGRLKEMETDEENELKKMGAELRKMPSTLVARLYDNFDAEYLFYPGMSAIYGIVLTAVETLVAGLIYFEYTFNPYTLPFVLLFMGLGWYFVYKLIEPRGWDHDESLKHMSFAEVCWIYLVLPILAPIIGYIPVILIGIVGIVYFLILNRVLWKTSGTHPKV